MLAFAIWLAISSGWGMQTTSAAVPGGPESPELPGPPEVHYVFDGMIPGDAYYFDQVMDVATDANGNVYAAERFGHRIVKLGAEGDLLAEWQGDDSFAPRAIAVDDEGYVYAATGEFVHKLDMDNLSIADSWEIEGMYASGLAVDSDSGIVYVADYDYSGIRLLDTASGTVEGWTEFTDSSELQQPFEYPYDVAIDGEGDVYVADRDNRIVKLNRYGAYLDQLDGEEIFDYLVGIAVDAEGNMFATDYDNNSVIAINSSFEVVTSVGEYGMGAGQFDSPQGIAVSADGSVYVADTANRRIQKLAAGTLASEAVWGTFGEEEGQFFIPEGIAVDGEGHIYVADQGNERIQLFDRHLQFLASRDGGGSYFSPYGLAVDSQGRLYMTSDNALLQYNPATNGITLMNSTHWLMNPMEVAVDADGYIYVANTAGYNIVKFDAAGEAVLEMEGVRDPNSFYFRPTAIAVDSERGIVYSADSVNIQTFDTEGVQLEESWGEPEGGGFGFISGIALDSEGNLFVTDETNSRIQKFNPGGELIASWGGPGKGEGEFDGLAAIAVDRAGNVYVTETGNHRVQKFAPATHTVSFESNEGTEVEAQTVSHGASVAEPTVPTRSGYTFEGWYVDSELTEAYTFATAVTGDITLYAKWTTSRYTVSFESNEGTEVEAQTVNHGASVAEPTVPTRSGYTFEGWYVDSELTEAYVFTTAVTGDMTLYAKWTTSRYTVSFESNEGTGVEARTVNHGASVAEPTAPTRTGYTFGGWYADSELAEAYVFTMAVTDNVTLYAKWTTSRYTVSFESNEGTEVEAQTVSHGATATEPTLPTREGYTFGGWYVDSELTETYAFATVVTGDMTLYAKWTLKSYTVSFESSEGTEVEAQTVSHGSTATEPTAPTRSGYTFGGWYVDSELTETYAFATVVTGDMTLYAKWTLKSYTVSFESNEGTEVEAQTVSHGATATEPTEPRREGYTFGGWYVDSELTEAYVFTTAVTDNVTLYAKWTMNRYTVSFESNEGTEVEGQMVSHGATATEPTAPTRMGYTFGGWYVDSELTEAYVFTTPVTDNVTLYAKWTTNRYTVSFESNEGTEVEGQTVSHGATATEPTLPTREGYTFGGWYADSELTEAYTFATAVTGDMTLYAKWTANVVVTPPPGSGSGDPPPGDEPESPAHVDEGLIINGEPGHAVITRTTDATGRSVTTVSIDWNESNQGLLGNTRDVVLSIQSDEDSDVLTAELDAELLVALIEQGGRIEIRTAFATYKIHANRLNLEALLKRLGPNIRSEDAVVRIEVARSTQDIVQRLMDRAEADGFEVIATPVHFAIWVKAGEFEIEAKSFNGYVERMIVIPNGVNPAQMTTGVVIGPDGTVRHVPTRLVEGDGGYAGAVHSLTNSDYALIGREAAFTDMNEHWAKNTVKDMNSRLIVFGIGENNFAPDRPVTRAEFAAILVRALGLAPDEAAGQSVFSDIGVGDWYVGAIGTAYENGLIGGFEDGTFRPNDQVTREQAMAMIANAMRLTGLASQSAGDRLDDFSDAENASDWARVALNAGLEAGILTGITANKLAPKATLTRAQAAVMIQRLLEKSSLI